GGRDFSRDGRTCGGSSLAKGHAHTTRTEGGSVATKNRPALPSGLSVGADGFEPSGLAQRDTLTRPERRAGRWQQKTARHCRAVFQSGRTDLNRQGSRSETRSHDPNGGRVGGNKKPPGIAERSFSRGGRI